MTQLTGHEPVHWHTVTDNGTVRHNRTDPRTIPDYKPAHWDADERAFVAHLEAHEDAANSVEPLPDDHDLVRGALAYIASKQRELSTLRDIVLTLRHELANGFLLEQCHAAHALRKWWAQSPGIPLGTSPACKVLTP